MKRTKLNYRFHNPNSAEDTADLHLLYFVSKKMAIEGDENKEEKETKTVPNSHNHIYGYI